MGVRTLEGKKVIDGLARKLGILSLLGEGAVYQYGNQSTRVNSFLQKRLEEFPVSVIARHAAHFRRLGIVDASLQTVVDMFAMPAAKKLPSVLKYAVSSVLLHPNDVKELVLRTMEADTKMEFAMPSQMKRGIAFAFAKFKDEALREVVDTSRELSIRDVMFVVHPKPRDVLSLGVEGSEPHRFGYSDTEKTYFDFANRTREVQKEGVRGYCLKTLFSKFPEFLRLGVKEEVLLPYVPQWVKNTKAQMCGHSEWFVYLLETLRLFQQGGYKSLQNSLVGAVIEELKTCHYFPRKTVLLVDLCASKTKIPGTPYTSLEVLSALAVLMGACSDRFYLYVNTYKGVTRVAHNVEGVSLYRQLTTMAGDPQENSLVLSYEENKKNALRTVLLKERKITQFVVLGSQFNLKELIERDSFLKESLQVCDGLYSVDMINSCNQNSLVVQDRVLFTLQETEKDKKVVRHFQIEGYSSSVSSVLTLLSLMSVRLLSATDSLVCTVSNARQAQIRYREKKVIKDE
jgi:hypothetical protein